MIQLGGHSGERARIVVATPRRPPAPPGDDDAASFPHGDLRSATTRYVAEERTRQARRTRHASGTYLRASRFVDDGT
jgi:hypothetical protein